VKLDIPVPPKYTSADFVKPSYWRARGKLDVPKERFISYPRMGRDGDGTQLLGWAGWDHLAQAQALATVYLDRKNNAAWRPDQLLPLPAGIAELERTGPPSAPCAASRNSPRQGDEWDVRADQPWMRREETENTDPLCFHLMDEVITRRG
jgi:hypothetical protein